MSLPQYQKYILGGQHSQGITHLANMKTLLVWTMGLLVVAVTLVTPGGSAPAPDSKHYTDKYDQMDIEPIMNNARTRKAFLKCLIEGESCTPEGETLKRPSKESLSALMGVRTEGQDHPIWFASPGGWLELKFRPEELTVFFPLNEFAISLH
uniref:Uncharacterized protein n=1 Tax=Timema bartmani TaxID=61472 RepID=A0A7R9I2C8_9NEOP|nr:unnamed protein product [Timema bartmani]